MKNVPLLKIFALVLTLNACSEDPKNPTQNYPEARIGVSISSIETNPFFQAAYQAYKDVGDKENNLTLYLESANNEQKIQNEQIEKMLQQGAQALVLNIVEVADGAKITEELCQRRIPVVFFNRSPGDKALANCPTAYFVDGDAVQAGVLQGLQVLTKWKQNPDWDKNKDGIIQYAMIEGIPGHAGAMARTKWSINTMASYPELATPVEKILQDTAMFQNKAAEELMQHWITDPNFQKVEVILANNDSMALGALKALREHNINLPVFGIDGSPEALLAIKDGQLAGTIFNDAKTQAEVSLRIAANLATKRPVLEGIEQKLEYQIIKIPYQNLDN